MGLDYVLKRIPAKFGDDQSILRQKIDDDELDTQISSQDDSWSYRSETHPKFFSSGSKKITD